jgi:hypothetical protein
MPGGVARDGWYPIGIGKRKLLRDGVPGEATVKHFYDMGDGESSNIGNVQYDFALEIRVPGREPYELQGLFRIPVKLVNAVGTGSIVPVKVHPSDPKRAVIDWEHFDPSMSPNLANDAPTAEEIRGQVHDAMPDATRTMMLDGWVQATQAGGLSKAEFDKTLTDAVSSGMVTQAEADAARAKLG